MPPKARVAREVKARPGARRSGGEQLGRNPRDTGGKRNRLTIQLEGKMADLYEGKITVADMDTEELARMQFKAVDGTFKGRKPSNLPVALVNMMRKELIDRVSEVRRGALEEANQTLVNIIKNEGAKDADRIKAALALIEREEGKVPEKVELSTGDKGFEVTMTRAIRMRRPGSSAD